MKHILLTSLLFIMITARSADGPFVNERILKAFNQTFIYAEDVIWQELNKISKVSFWQNNLYVNAYYDELGNLLGTVRYYYEKQLPPVVLSKIKKRYAGKTILSVTEVSNEEDITYHLSLQDEDQLYYIISDMFGNLRQIYKYNRADK